MSHTGRMVNIHTGKLVSEEEARIINLTLAKTPHEAMVNYFKDLEYARKRYDRAMLMMRKASSGVIAESQAEQCL